MTRTKIICTIGPAVNSLEKIAELMEAGMDVARLNFSHGTHEEHSRTIEFLKKARQAAGRPLAIMLDTQGPEVRIGKVHGGAIPLVPKQKVRLAPDGDGLETIPLPCREVLAVLAPGMRVLFDDGYIIGIVSESSPDFALIEILNGGSLKSGKKMNIPGVHIPIPSITEKDIADLRFGCEHDLDLVAASFIRSAHDVLSIRELLAQAGKPNMPVIAKIESTEGVDHFDSIVQVADGIMIARGDLGVELDLSLVPKLQKMMIRKCFQAGKPSITATQMLESMIGNPRPSRAEASDVANAIYDCTSCIMLSGETAVGAYPVESVQWMRDIAREAESDFHYRNFFEEHSRRDYHDVSSAVAMSAVKTAYSANAKAIFALTASGSTARLISRLRPEMPVIGVTPDPSVYQQLALSWGVIPVLAKGCKNLQEAFGTAARFALERGLISFGDVVVITAGTPFGKRGTTNMILVENIGEVLVRGHKGSGLKVSGTIAIVRSPEARKAQDLKGKLVVLSHCDNAFLPVLKGVTGIILQNYIGDLDSEAYVAMIAKTFDIPYMLRADGALSILKEGSEVTLDPQRGLVYRGTEESTVLLTL